MRLFDGEKLRGIPWPVGAIGIPAGFHATPSQKKRLGKREKRFRWQGSPARGQNANDDASQNLNYK